MATSDQAVGLYTGQTRDAQVMGRYNQDFTDVKTASPTTTTGTGVTSKSGVSSGTQNSFQLNTTPKILAGLEAFIDQMTDRPAVSQAELDKIAPLAVRQFQAQGRYGNAGQWVWVDPATGRSFRNEAEATAFNTAQQVKRQKIIQEAGIIKGGTEEQRAISDARMLEIERNRTTQAGYTKDAAFADAKALSAYFSRVLMEQQLPGILRAAEGAGTSQSSMRALLASRAAEVTAEQAAKVGLEAASSYGQVNNQLAGVLEQLTRQDPNSITSQLLQALSIGKGIQTAGSTNTSQVQSGTEASTSTAQKSGATETTVRDFVAPTPAGMPQLQMERPNVNPVSSTGGTGYIIANPAPQYTNSPEGDSGGSPTTFYDEEEFQI